MHQSEIELIISYLNPNYKMFEWGCGGSTLYFSKYVSFYRSIEHQKTWFDKIKPIVSDNTELYHIEDTNNYTNYINAISNYKDKYDAVLIDGRQRVKCAEKCAEYLNINGYIFIHDYFNRPKYHSIHNIPKYNLIDGIRNTQQTLAVFQYK